ncbi:MAG: hypothetical protein Fur0018_28300 [Anaerolineales bacterium]
MLQKEFGLLIKAMRREMACLRGEKWTQTELARRANATPKIISNLERGTKARIEPELLYGLANAFQLSLSERMAFFSLANTISEEALVPPSQPPQETIRPLLTILANARQPAFLVDALDNVIAANSLLFGMFPFLRRLLAEPQTFPGAYNAMRFVFSSESGFAERVTHNREVYLRQSLYRFRVMTLPYRATRYYYEMMQYFCQHPEMHLFATMYAQRLSEQPCPPASHITFTLPAEERAVSISAITAAPMNTPHGPLYLVLHIPADTQTLKYFNHLAGSGPAAVHTLAPWPLQIEWMEFEDEEEDEPQDEEEQPEPQMQDA